MRDERWEAFTDRPMKSGEACNVFIRTLSIPQKRKLLGSIRELEPIAFGLFRVLSRFDNWYEMVSDLVHFT